MNCGIDGRHGKVTFEPGENLAVEAAAVSLRTLLESGVEFPGNVLECKRKHNVLMEPLWNRNRLALTVRVVNMEWPKRPSQRVEFRYFFHSCL